MSAQAEIIDLQLGLWGQVGGNLDTKGHPGFVGSVGWSFLGVEIQNRVFDDPYGRNWALLGKIRIPFGLIIKALGARH